MAEWPYDTAAWRRLRKTKLQADPLCQYCPPGTFTVASSVDHWQAIAAGGEPFAWENLVSTCQPCHSRKTAAFDGSFGRRATSVVRTRGVDPATGLPLDPAHWWSPNELARPSGLPRSAVPLILVCGPSGGGKTTYARAHAGTADVVIDLDDITAELAGVPAYEAPRRWLAAALEARNRRLAALASERSAPAAWFIVSAPRADERRAWATMLGAGQVIVVATEIDRCVAQLRSDTKRPRCWPYFALLAHAWWAHYEPRAGDTILENLSELTTTDRCRPYKEFFAGFE